MESLREIVEFRSSRFQPVLPDEWQVNPQCYGAELGFWLCGALAKHGVVTSYPYATDLDWVLEYVSETGREFALHCANIEEENDRWLLSLSGQERRLFRRIPPRETDATPLTEALRKILALEESISEIKWRVGGPEVP